MRQDSIDASFLLNDRKVTALKKDLVKKQFIMKIFEFFPKLDILRVQILNKRFYVKITPNWLHKIVLNKPILTFLSPLWLDKTLFSFQSLLPAKSFTDT
jgi:hypothetical protein